MTQETLQLGGAVAIAMALIELVKFVINKYTGTKTIDDKNDDKNEEIYDQLKLMNENHLHAIELAIREQTKLFQEDHNRNLEVLYQIKANTEILKK